jgi:hypothetical protein
MQARYIPARLETCATLAAHCKETTSPEQWQQAFKDLLNHTYPTHQEIYTDGSTKDN